MTRLEELAELCEARPLTDDELVEAQALAMGADVLSGLEAFLAKWSES